MAPMRLSDLPPDVNDISEHAFDAAIEVQNSLGNRLSERCYKLCLAHELRLRGHRGEVEAPISLRYNDLVVPEAFFADILVDDRVVIELECVPQLTTDEEGQLLTHPYHPRSPLGMLFDFRAPRIRDDFRRFANRPWILREHFARLRDTSRPVTSCDRRSEER